ncbi:MULTISPECIES: hypothetical protein [unclassified Legionella]|uniref:hypothetical protein n=1 Tax=unclassified Legionella TaxID=2622702 RepID=UPI00105434FE|nr:MULTISPECIES: hypothetical protein [unclassified Legionella]MDI9818193.1 hypothetical protein [Legionella sp. PL877]
MSYRLDIKKEVLIRSNDRTIASKQQSALDFPLFSSFSITLHGVSFLYSESCFISLLYLNPMVHVCAFIPLCQSIAADCIIFLLNGSVLLCKERL